MPIIFETYVLTIYEPISLFYRLDISTDPLGILCSQHTMLRRARALTHLYRLTAQPCRKNSIEIGNRQFLAGSDGPKFPKYLKAPPEDMPKVLHPNECKSFDAQTKRFVPEFYKELETLVNQYGGLLLRDFPLDGVEDFSNFVAGIESKSMEYLAGIAYRNQVSSNVFTASNEPPCLNIEPHNEMCYKKEWPKWVSVDAKQSVHLDIYMHQS